MRIGTYRFIHSHRVRIPPFSTFNKDRTSILGFMKNSSMAKVKVFIPMYEPLQISKCEKCGKVIAEPKEPIEA